MYCYAGIVLYNPEIDRLKENIDAIKRQVTKIILVDNNSDNINEISQLLLEYENVSLIRNRDNIGIAAALNQICEKSISEDYKWVLLLDQDSICSDTLISSYKNYTEDTTIALLTPYIVDINKMSLEDFFSINLPRYSHVNWAITSGSLIRLSVWKEIGKFDEDLFIDGVDIDYSIRIRINGYSQVRVNTEYLLQEVGKAEPTFIFRPHRDNSGRWTIKRYYRSNHSLMRQYYMTRNRIIISKKYRLYNSIIKEIVITACITIPKLVFEKSKLNLLIKIVQGIYDGIRFKVEKYKI
ncbi:glycosyltransferase family 2 protein [Psychrobacillus sp.]|uniref:glycosyltransferase family 2 protein n=1 Tax=Psychrobacillus sp. TaxID=1871623 RepID=UPI0028BF1D2C|nr:glycosyltransferase family 2 protein [Psychrobacillus sp.]